MKADNALSLEFLTSHPSEAARVLEQLPPDYVATFLSQVSADIGADAVEFMLAKNAAGILNIMPRESAASLLSMMSLHSAVRIYRLLSTDCQHEVATHFSKKTQAGFNRMMAYPSDTVGAFLEPNIDVLPMSLTVAEAIKRVEHLDHAVGCDLYIVDDLYHLVGRIELGRLLTSPHQVKLSAIMNRKLQPISVHAAIDRVVGHPAWSTNRRLPVIERDQILLGLLDYESLRVSSDEMSVVSPHGAMSDFMSLAELYWFSATRLIDNLLPAKTKKEAGHHDS